jgi:hypothetical protein
MHSICAPTKLCDHGSPLIFFPHQIFSVCPPHTASSSTWFISVLMSMASTFPFFPSPTTTFGGWQFPPSDGCVTSRLPFLGLLVDCPQRQAAWRLTMTVSLLVWIVRTTMNLQVSFCCLYARSTIVAQSVPISSEDFIFVDYQGLDESIRSSFLTPRRHDFRSDMIQRDGIFLRHHGSTVRVF